MIKGVKRWWRAESGLSEAASAIFILPFMFFLLFALVEAGVNLNYRSQIDTITQATVTKIGQDGALYWSRTTDMPGYPAGTTWQQWGQGKLGTLCGQGGARCTQPPTMTCTVTPSLSAPPDAVQVATYAGADVTCTARFYYNPVSPLSKTPVTSMGFDRMFTRPIQSVVKGVTTVGANG